MSHANISIFVPHLGCPHCCSFCSQYSITGETEVPDFNDVHSAVNAAKSSPGYDPENTELAFFGGSFTGIERGYMETLLCAAYEHIKAGEISGIRISTRPDYVNREILDILKNYGVTSIELGAQSMCDDVLKLNLRGHSADDVRAASRLIREYGFSLGLQMMTGLYGSDAEKDTYTSREIAALHPDTVRIYPTVTLKGTVLHKKFLSGEYVPPTLEQTVSLCAELKVFFGENGINVIRVGLHSIEKDSYIAGPWHPAFGEQVESRIMLNKVLCKLKEKGSYMIYVNPSDVSKMTGQKRMNLQLLKADGYICKVSADGNVPSRQIITERIDDACS